MANEDKVLCPVCHTNEITMFEHEKWFYCEECDNDPDKESEGETMENPIITQVIKVSEEPDNLAGWIAEDGSYGMCDILVFKESDIPKDCWDIFNELGDNERFEFVKAVINKEDLSQWKEQV
jgi:hypothetical protein